MMRMPNSSRQIVSRYRIQFLLLFVLFLYLTSFFTYNSNNAKKVADASTTVSVNHHNNNNDHTNNYNNHNNNHNNNKPDIQIPTEDDQPRHREEERRHKTSEKFDCTIVVLGYTLHSDGMPSRILKDRVDTAVDLFQQLQSEGANPLLVFSGKGKGDTTDDEFEYKSEADAMRSMVLNSADAKIEETSIYMDLESTNTAENAKNTLTRLLAEGITRVFIVTSDFHMLRAQYIFNTIFPPKYELNFVVTHTSEKTQKAMLAQERLLYLSSQKDLEGLGMLGTDSALGYHPFRNLPRWNMIEREIESDIRNNRVIEKGSMCADYGSNHGYFSVRLAQKLPNAEVVSLEGEAMKEYNNAQEAHETKILELGLTNNYLCKTRVQTNMFQQMVSKKHVYEYQLCLSVFHWFGMQTKEEFETVLLNHLMNAKTTFIELPEPMLYKGSEGQHEWKKVNIWYDGRNEDEIFNDLRKRYDLDLTWKILGALSHENKTVRKVIRVDLKHADRAPLTLKELKEIYNCKVE